MNQPTREEFNELKEQVRKLEQQQTEPINVRVERGLSLGEETMLKTIMDMVGKQGPDIGQLKVDMGRVQTDVSTLKQDVSTIKGDIVALNYRMDKAERKMDEGFQAMEKRFDAIAEVQKMILARLPEKGE